MPTSRTNFNYQRLLPIPQQLHRPLSLFLLTVFSRFVPSRRRSRRSYMMVPISLLSIHLAMCHRQGLTSPICPIHPNSTQPQQSANRHPQDPCTECPYSPSNYTPHSAHQEQDRCGYPRGWRRGGGKYGKVHKTRAFDCEENRDEKEGIDCRCYL